MLALRRASRAVCSPALNSRSFATLPPRRRTRDGQRLILGIETSCDDSCAALVSCPDSYTAEAFTPESPARAKSQAPTVVSSVIVRQDHGETAGIHPLVAQTCHMQALPGAIRKCLDEGGISPDGREIDAIAFTHGPGMPGCLSVGLTAAKTLASTWSKPLIPVHHMEAHALTPFLLQKTEDGGSPLKFPFLTFLLSGGHTMLVLAKRLGEYEILANGECEAIGASFDNAARYFSLTTDWNVRSPGAALEAFAADAPTECPADLGPLIKALKVPLRGVPQFAYSGLTSGVYQQEKHIAEKLGHPTKIAELPIPWQKYIAAQYQAAAFAQLTDKIKMVLQGAAKLQEKRYMDSLLEASPSATVDDAPLKPSKFKPKAYPPAWQKSAETIASCRHLIVSGGVASNAVLRSTLADIWRQDDGKKLLFPPIQYCVDNAVMIANVGALVFDHYVDADNGQRKTPLYDEAMKTVPRGKWSMETLAAERGLVT